MKKFKFLFTLGLVAFGLTAGVCGSCSDDDGAATPNDSRGQGATSYQPGTPVDLGLSVKWADRNVGAAGPENSGGYYAWGETDEKEDYSKQTYKYYKGSSYENICMVTLDSIYDVASVKWGGTWRMPTNDEMAELIDSCAWVWTTEDSVYGYKVTGPNGNSIFLPRTGYRFDTQFYSEAAIGIYWTSSIHGENSQGPNDARILYFMSNTHNVSYNCREFGQCVRPVCP